jgi:ADP-ribose pyrophosphatase YjhB (NUDIX family)
MKAFLFRLWRLLPIPKWAQWRIIWLLVPKFMVGAVAVILNEKGQVLLFHHTYRKDQPWGLPGGWLDHDEESIDTIVRELREEAGMTIEVERLLYAGTSKQYPRIDIAYLCRHIEGEFRPCAEVSEARFVDFETLESDMEPGHFDLLKNALDETFSSPSRA